MCELFGFTSARELNIAPQLTEFFSHSVQHPHGWGLAFQEGEKFRLEKEPVRAVDSVFVEKLLQTPLETRLALGHIRLATIGVTAWSNCHPFTARDLTGRHWTLIHNGTIFSFPPMDPFYAHTDSDTDSACLLSYILSRINGAYRAQKSPLSPAQRFHLLEEIIEALAPGNKVNLMIYDGEQLYVHTNYQNSLYQRHTEYGVMFSTRPLADSAWEPVPFTRLLAYRDGQLVATGQCHGAEYLENPEQMKLLYLAYAGL